MGLDVEFYLRGAEEPVHYLRNHWLSGGNVARMFYKDFGKPDGAFETVHFRDFTATIFFQDGSGGSISDIRLFVDPAETLAESTPARRRDPRDLRVSRRMERLFEPLPI